MNQVQICYVFDGTFEGLLTAIYEAYYQSEKPDLIVSDKNYQDSLLVKNVLIDTDSAKSDKVYESIIKKISYEALKKVFGVFLSELPESGTLIYKYLRLGWKIGGKVNNYLSEDAVLAMENIYKKVSFERHRLLGLIRFKKVKGDIYYAQIEPDYNIVSLLASHFVRRFNDQNFIIHDVKRNSAVIYNKSEWIVSDFTVDQAIALDNEEKIMQDLWKEFFNAIAIKNRINPRLQRQFMPKRYWKYLIEKQNY